MSALRIIIVLLATLFMSSVAHSKTSWDIEIHAGQATILAERGLDKEAQHLADQASHWLTLMQDDLRGLPVPTSVEMRLVKDSASLSDAAPNGRRVTSWASGVMFPGTNIVIVARKKDSEILDYASTARHELAHLALDAALGKNAPRWLHEGFAYLHSSEWSTARMNTLVAMAWTGNVYPLSTIEDHFPKQENSVHKAYAQSYDFVAYLAKRGHYVDLDDDGNRWPFRTFLAELAAGATQDDASHLAFGASFGQLQNQWYESLRARYLFVPSSLVGVFVWAMAALLLIIGYLRKKKKNLKTLHRWEEEDIARQRQRSLDSKSPLSFTSDVSF